MLFGVGKKEVHFLMGAGASYASSDTTPFRVPLGQGLFESMEESLDSWHLSNLDEGTKEIFRKDFEKGMDVFFAKEIDPTWMQNELSKYFLRFSIGDSNIYIKLIGVLEDNNAVYSFSTTNYELLIEQSLAKKGKYPYYGIDIRTESSNLVSVLKIHGSSNFVADADLSTTVMSGCKVPSRTSIASYPTKATMPEEAYNFASSNSGFAPSLAMYAKGKNVLHAPRAVDFQHDLWKMKLKHQCNILVIVGLRVIEHDNHIWDFLGFELTIPILYIGDREEFQDWVNRTNRASCVYIGSKFEESLPCLEEYIAGAKHVE